jgi:hypothetical protein
VNGSSIFSGFEPRTDSIGPPQERFLVAGSEPPIGAHIVTRRQGYTHHGIYAGVGRVVHYAGLSRGLRRGPVEETSLSRFAAGHRDSTV